jgi:hypothetical protein
MLQKNDNKCCKKQQQQSNHDNQRIIPTFALLQDKIFMLPMERK